MNWLNSLFSPCKANKEKGVAVFVGKRQYQPVAVSVGSIHLNENFDFQGNLGRLC